MTLLKGSAMGWAQAADEFRRYLITIGRSDGTAHTYVSNLSLFWHWCANHEMDSRDADRVLVRAWISDRMAVVSSQRAHNDLAALRHYYRMLIEDRYREDDPTANMRVKRQKALPTEPLDDDELGLLLGACREERDRLILLMLASTGMRISELASLSADNIDWRKGEIRVVGKGDKERRIAPNPEVLGRLHAYCGMFPEGPLWLSKRQGNQLSAHQIRKILYDLAERAHLKGVHPHRLRSFFATKYIEQFADIQALQGVLGHNSIETTARYSEYTRARRGLEQTKMLRLVG